MNHNQRIQFIYLSAAIFFIAMAMFYTFYSETEEKLPTDKDAIYVHHSCGEQMTLGEIPQHIVVCRYTRKTPAAANT